MKICKVVGNVWATRKQKCLNGLKLLLVQPIDNDTGKAKGDVMLAVEKNVGAGIGNIVLVNDEGNSARQMLEKPVAGIRTVVCGIVDETTVSGKTKKYH
ncbi:MAG: EutN/CcmL family microcompartment protein [bacterium]